MGLKEDLKDYQKGNKAALDNPKPGEEKKGEKRKVEINTESLTRLVKRLTPDQRDELRAIILDVEMDEENPDDEDEEELETEEGETEDV